MGAKSRWIVQGFHNPDIAVLNRSVPTPETSDVPLTLQLLASIRARIWAGDIKSGFMQGLKGIRKEPLFASMPPEGIPGEGDPDTLIELLAEAYGLITGPPLETHTTTRIEATRLQSSSSSTMRSFDVFRREQRS